MRNYSVSNSSLNTSVSSDFYVKKEKIAICNVILFSLLEGKIAKEVHERTFPTLGDSYSSYEAIAFGLMSSSAGEHSLKTQYVLGNQKLPSYTERKHIVRLWL